MGVVQVFTKARMAAIEALAIVSGAVVGDNLILTRNNGQTINAGNVRGANGPAGNPLLSWPVGSVFINTTSTSPATLLGGGTWEAFGQGRVLVGVDPNDTQFDVSGETGGAKTHTLTETEMPSHNHTINHSHTVQTRPAGPGAQASVVTQASGTMAIVDGAAVNTFTGNSGLKGGGDPHNNLQPYITAYMWRRTA